MISEDKFKDLMRDVIDERVKVDAGIHAAHHEFISQWIEIAKIRKRRCEKIRTQVFGWGIIATLGAVGTFVAKRIGY